VVLSHLPPPAFGVFGLLPYPSPLIWLTKLTFSVLQSPTLSPAAPAHMVKLLCFTNLQDQARAAHGQEREKARNTPEVWKLQPSIQ
jgi:hypothetical protein